MSPKKQIDSHCEGNPIKVSVINPKLTQGPHKLRLNFNIKDDTATRKVVAWDQQATNIYARLQADKIYTIKNYNAYEPKAQYNKDPVQFEFTSTTEYVSEDDDEDFANDRPQPMANAIKQREVVTIEGTITHIADMKPSGSVKMPLRIVNMVDNSQVECQVLFFKELAEEFPYAVGQGLKITNVRSDRTKFIVTSSAVITESHVTAPDDYQHVIAAPEPETKPLGFFPKSPSRGRIYSPRYCADSNICW